ERPRRSGTTELPPAKVAAEQLVEARVRFGELGCEAPPSLRAHPGVVLLVHAGVGLELVPRAPEELEDAAVRLRGLHDQVVARDRRDRGGGRSASRRGRSPSAAGAPAGGTGIPGSPHPRSGHRSEAETGRGTTPSRGGSGGRSS